MQECLASHRPLLSWDCQEQLFRQEVENAEDLRLSVRLFRACLADKKKVHHLPTLMLPSLLFTADVCGSQLYRKSHLASVLQGCLALWQKCTPEHLCLLTLCLANWGGSLHLSRSVAVLQFCADVPPGNARAKECLEDNREKPGFTPQCKEEVEKMMADRATDFRLDPKLRQLCADDIQVAPRCMPATTRQKAP